MASTTPEKVVETVLAYYRQADTLYPTLDELVNWAQQLSPTQQDELVVVGLPQVVKLPAFRRYILEKRGFLMSAYMLAHLTSTELEFWVDDNDGE